MTLHATTFRILIRAATTLVCVVMLGPATTFAHSSSCLRLDKGERKVHVIYGRFVRGKPKISYCLYGRAGQELRITVKPLGNLNTEGQLRFAGVPSQPDWAPGSPGGVVFDEALPWAGEYRLVVGQRYNEKKIGKFSIKISTD
jgi:hypothetical protein